MNSSHQPEVPIIKDYNRPIITLEERELKYENPIGYRAHVMNLQRDIVVVFKGDRISVGRFDDDSNFEMIATVEGQGDENNNRAGISKSPSGKKFLAWELPELKEDNFSIIRIWDWQEGKIIETNAIKYPYRIDYAAMVNETGKLILRSGKNCYFADTETNCTTLIDDNVSEVIVMQDGKIITFTVQDEQKSLIKIRDEAAKAIFKTLIPGQINNLCELTKNKLIVNMPKCNLTVIDLEKRRLDYLAMCGDVIYCNSQFIPSGRFTPLGEGRVAIHNGLNRVAIVNAFPSLSIAEYHNEMSIERQMNIIEGLFSTKEGNLAIVRQKILKNFEDVAPIVEVLRFHDEQSFAREEAKQKVELEQRDAEGNTFLHHAAKLNAVEMVRFYIKQGIDVETKNNNGQTPLLLAISENCWDVALDLIKQGASVFARDNKKESVLFLFFSHCIESSKKVTLVGRALIDAGGAINCYLDRWRAPSLFKYFSLKNCLLFNLTLENVGIDRLNLLLERSGCIYNHTKLKKAILSQSIDRVKTHNQFISVLAEYPEDEKLQEAVNMITKLSACVSLKEYSIFKVARLVHQDPRIKERLEKEAPQELIEQVAQIKLGN